MQEIASAPLVNRTGFVIHSVNCLVDYVAKIHAPGEQASKLAGIECKDVSRQLLQQHKGSNFDKQPAQLD